MKSTPSTAELLRDVVRRYVRAQRASAACLNGSSTVQCHVLTELLRHEQMTQKTLAERLGLDKGWISRAVDALMTEGMLIRMPSATDKRSGWIKLTETGRARAMTLNAQLNQHAEQLLSVVPSEQHRALHASLLQLQQALDAHTTNCNSEASCKQINSF